MTNQLVCPNCKKKIPNNDIINDVIKGEGSYMRQIQCACGEKMTYWQIKALLRDQGTLSWRFRNWLRGLNQSKN